jgi:hypothetical protein
MSEAESGATPLGVFLFLLFAIGWCISIVAFVRTYRTPDRDFQEISKTRNGQLALYGIGVATVFLGGLVGWFWLFSTRRHLPALPKKAFQERSQYQLPRWATNRKVWIWAGSGFVVFSLIAAQFGNDEKSAGSTETIPASLTPETVPETTPPPETPAPSTVAPTTPPTTPAPTPPPTTLPRGNLSDIEVRSSKFIWKDSGLDWIWRPDGEYVNRSDREIVYFQVTYEIYTTDGVFTARFVDDPDTDVPPGGTMKIMPTRWFNLYVTRSNHAQIGSALSYGGGAAYFFYVNYIRYGDFTSVGSEVFL